MKAKLFQVVLVCLAAFIGAALVQWVSAGKAVGQDYDNKEYTLQTDLYRFVVGYNTEGKRSYYRIANLSGSMTDTTILADDHENYPRYSCYPEIKKGGLYVFDQETGTLWYNAAGTPTMKTIAAD